MDDYGNAAYYNSAGEKVDRVLFAGTGKDGKPGSFAIGQRKGPSLDEATRNWSSGYSAFEILEVAEDGRKLQDELNDLSRDAHGMEIAQRVSHGVQSEQAPGFDLAGTSDEEVDRRLQEYLKRGKQSE
jgi:hypothetical protein